MYLFPFVQRPWEKEWELTAPLLRTYADRLRCVTVRLGCGATLTRCRHGASERAQVPLQVLRANQLDASLLDNELNSILKSSFTRIFSLFRVRNGDGLFM